MIYSELGCPSNARVVGLMGRPQCVYVGHHMELHPKDIMGKPTPYSARDLPGTPVTNAPKFPKLFLRLSHNLKNMNSSHKFTYHITSGFGFPFFFPPERSKRLSHSHAPLLRSTSYSAHCLHRRALGNGPGTAARRFWRSKVTGVTS